MVGSVGEWTAEGYWQSELRSWIKILFLPKVYV